jgi:hypothetical protein
MDARHGTYKCNATRLNKYLTGPHHTHHNCSLLSSPSMPHSIFLIDELVRLVIEEVVEAGPRTTASFALTCRGFKDPTLRLLWKHQHSLTNLLKVLPCCPPVYEVCNDKVVCSVS